MSTRRTKWFVRDFMEVLRMESAQEGTNYAPWGNWAIFIRDFEYSSGLVLLGKIDGEIDALNVPGTVSVTIEIIR